MYVYGKSSPAHELFYFGLFIFFHNFFQSKCHLQNIALRNVLISFFFFGNPNHEWTLNLEFATPKNNNAKKHVKLCIKNYILIFCICSFLPKY